MPPLIAFRVEPLLTGLCFLLFGLGLRLRLGLWLGLMLLLMLLVQLELLLQLLLPLVNRLAMVVWGSVVPATTTLLEVPRPHLAFACVRPCRDVAAVCR